MTDRLDELWGVDHMKDLYNKAQGTREANNLRDALMKKLMNYLGRNRSGASALTIGSFLATQVKDGHDYTDIVSKAVNDIFAPKAAPAPKAGTNVKNDPPPIVTPQATPATPATPAAGATQNMGRNAKAGAYYGASNPGLTDNAQYINKTAAAIRKDAFNPATAQQAMAMTHELYKFAQDHGGQDQTRVKAFIQSLKSNKQIYQNPRFAQMLANMTTETFHQIIDHAVFLIEYGLNTHSEIRGALTFLMEKEIPVNSLASNAVKRSDDSSNRQLSRGQVLTVLYNVAVAMMNNGHSYGKKRANRNDYDHHTYDNSNKGWFGKIFGDSDENKNTKPSNAEPGVPPRTNNKGIVTMGKFKEMAAIKHLGQSDIDAVKSALSNGYQRVEDIIDFIHKKKLPFTTHGIETLIASRTGHV